MIKVGQQYALPGISWLRRYLSRRTPSVSAPYVDEETMPEWQKRDLGFRDGRMNIHDDIRSR